MGPCNTLTHSQTQKPRRRGKKHSAIRLFFAPGRFLIYLYPSRRCLSSSPASLPFPYSLPHLSPSFQMNSCCLQAADSLVTPAEESRRAEVPDTFVRSRPFSNARSLLLTPPYQSKCTRTQTCTHRHIQHPSNTESSVPAMKPNLIFGERPGSSFIGLFNCTHKNAGKPTGVGKTLRQFVQGGVGVGRTKRKSRPVLSEIYVAL